MESPFKYKGKRKQKTNTFRLSDKTQKYVQMMRQLKIVKFASYEFICTDLFYNFLINYKLVSKKIKWND